MQPAPVPSITEIKSSIPAHCFAPSAWRSLFYVFFDLSVIAGLFGLAWYIDSWYFWPVYWLLQGTMFWALFVAGHDCGHGSFSRHRWLNSLVGHICHTPILVPYHGWRISHRTHHQNTGHVENDETWYPVTESEYRAMPAHIKVLRFYIFLILFPLYLFRRSPNKDGSHFLPGSDLFRPSEKWDVLTSTFWWTVFFTGLCAAAWHFGIAAVAKYYIAPYFVFVCWLDLVTYLHHTSPEVPWYRGKAWTFVRGNLSSIDRSYGIFEWFHHNIGTHVVHHLFAGIPHYHLKEATRAMIPVLGDQYHKSEEPIYKEFLRAFTKCKVVPDTGDVVYYKDRVTEEQPREVVYQTANAAAGIAAVSEPVHSLAAIRSVIPEHCLKPHTGRAMLYIATGLTFTTIAGIFAWWVWKEALVWLYPVSWFVGGTAFTSLFVLAHDCGHYALLKSKRAMNLLGHVLLLPMFYPFYAWKHSHDAHHKYTNLLKRSEDIYFDNAWIPETVEQYNTEKQSSPFFAFLYKLARSVPVLGSWMHQTHYLIANPGMYREDHRKRVIGSLIFLTVCVALAAPAIVYFAGWFALLHFWVLPALAFQFWMSVYTFLHHTAEDVPFLEEGEWTPFRGQVECTVNVLWPRPISFLHGNIDVHLPHHIAANIPAYWLRDAYAAIKASPYASLVVERKFSPAYLWRTMRACRLWDSDKKRYAPFAS